MYTLVIGAKDDVVVQHFFQQIDLKRNPYLVFMDVRQLGGDLSLTEDLWILPGGGEIPHNQVEHVYNRMLCEVPSDCHRAQYDYLCWLLDESYRYVINRPKYTMSNFSKIWQLDVAKTLGLHTPKSHVVANGQRLDHWKQMIFKSVSSHRSIVASVGDNFRKSVHEPVLFQQDCGRINVRVHILDQEVFAHQIESVGVDYRYDRSMRMRCCQIPDELQQQCQQLAQYFNLRFAGIDFMLNKGIYYFLEINPSPGYAYYEQCTQDLGLSQSLINRLGLYV